MATQLTNVYRKTCRKLLSGCMALALVFTPGLKVYADERPTNAAINLNTLELLSYQSPGYTFLMTSQNASPPAGFEQPDFDDSGFRTGIAAFGGGGGGMIGGGDCPLRPTVQTRWRDGSRLFVRHVLEIPDGATNLRILLSVDNNVIGAFFNGVSLISEPIMHGDCPIVDEFRIDVPSSLVQPGQNLIAFELQDINTPTGNESFFDARVLAELRDRRVAKLAADIQGDLQTRVPAVPVSQVTTECPTPSPEGPSQARVQFMVEGTGARGLVQVTTAQQRGLNLVTTEHMMDGEAMYTTTVEPRRVLLEVNPEPLQRARVEVTNMAAFPAVLQRGLVTAGLVDCMANNRRILRPAVSCAESIRTASEDCQLMCGAEPRAQIVRCLRAGGGSRCVGGGKISRLEIIIFESDLANCTQGCINAETSLLASCQ